MLRKRFAITAAVFCIVAVNRVQSLRCQAGTYPDHSGTTCVIDIEDMTAKKYESSHCKQLKIMEKIVDKGDVEDK